ncbi:uncharacterized protein EI97DRAFT_277177 [Westerdykella ornata]|uniref:Ribosome biogenesis protein SLX9 n=1 Tax=Westerdykella ornata TaxID=318751 RepID=A0A6A6JNQ8_WESOR|nr:uncharacterized protein EI97DRAFT_277177 [Westerdykella ornata]KAF2277894.1 hypothetical protein EI97DRAFT_277177 [Westerdykella ornata]
MAPTKKRSSLRAKAAAVRPRPPLPLSAPISKSKPTPSTLDHEEGDGGDFHFPTSKRDKKAIKHSSFVSRIEKSGSKTPKRRRPNKKLVANLESLADALPEIEGARDGGSGADGGNGVEVVVGQAKVRVRGGGLKSMKSRPGAMKRKEKLERMERERFNANLVQLSAGRGTEARWAALRRHVEGNVERRGDFAGK